MKMLYPIYVHLGDEKHAHGVTIPDFPGCFTAADEWDALPRQVQEAVETYFEGEDMEIPPPTPLEKLAADPDYQGGAWMLVDIDLSRIDTKSVRLNISLPANVVAKIDGYAKDHHMSRSGFLAKAALQAIAVDVASAHAESFRDLSQRTQEVLDAIEALSKSVVASRENA